MYDFPARSVRTLDPSMSMPMTGIPASAYSIASGSPTYPKPTIAAVKFFSLMRDSRPFSFRVPAMFLAIPPSCPPCPGRVLSHTFIGTGPEKYQADFSFFSSAIISGTALKRSATSP